MKNTLEPAADKAKVCLGMDGKVNVVKKNNCTNADMTHKIILKILLQALHNIWLSSRKPLIQMSMPHPAMQGRNIINNYFNHLEILKDHLYFKLVC